MDKFIKYYQFIKFNKYRVCEKVFNNENDLDLYINRYVGSIKDYFEAFKGGNFTAYNLEIETKNDVIHCLLYVIYQ